MAHAAMDPSARLTPSEMIFLHGEQFASKVMVGNIDLMHTDAKVSVAQLGEAMLAAAFLANEAAGTLRLQVRPKKALLGLRTVEALYADPAGEVAWPAPSLESDLRPLAVRYQMGGDEHEVRNVVYGWLERDSGMPWKAAIERVQAHMAARQLLTATEERRLKVFRVTHYELPPSTLSLAAAQSIEPVQQLLADCERQRPQVWKLLVQAIKAAIKARTERSDDDF